jgi:hypothetical protein
MLSERDSSNQGPESAAPKRTLTEGTLHVRQDPERTFKIEETISPAGRVSLK